MATKKKNRSYAKRAVRRALKNSTALMTVTGKFLNVFKFGTGLRAKNIKGE